MKASWAGNEQGINKSRTCYEQVMKKFWASYEQVETTKTWATQEQVMIKIWKIKTKMSKQKASNKQALSKPCTCHEQDMCKSWKGCLLGANHLGLPPDGNEKSSPVIYIVTFKVFSSDLMRR